jgi:hypothetical protein
MSIRGSGRFFEKKLRKKLLLAFTRGVSTSPGGKLTKVFCGAFFQKSDHFPSLPELFA